MTGWDIYWVMQLDSIRNVLGVTLFVLVLCFIFSILFLLAAFDKSFVMDDGTRKFLKKLPFWLFFWLVLNVSMVAFLPSTKTACAIVVLPKIVNNEQLKEDASEIYGLAVEKLKESLQIEEQEEPK